ncbi:hypothetical protein Sjap_005505 [Stephania japonica]|uniref:Uncharacterized protein n=1 Tax=Stephania japonica TaxID=461633 RepID=A0AAP0K486_9MAGN
MSVVNTALSVMAYEYPTDKISVYVSDDGGSKLTLFAFMEAANFARYWLPFCREKRLVETSPEAYFRRSHGCSSKDEQMKTIYEAMKGRVENIIEKGEVNEYHTTNQLHRHDTLNKWKSSFTRQDHPTIIEVLLDSDEDEDLTGHKMPNLVYVSREKSRTSHHHFKAGALNVLTRVSATMTNAPVILTLDCDMYSNDPITPLRALCFLWEPLKGLELAYVQFPQHFCGINENDIYANEIKRLFRQNPIGMDGLKGLVMSEPVASFVEEHSSEALRCSWLWKEENWIQNMLSVRMLSLKQFFLRLILWLAATMKMEQIGVQRLDLDMDL